MCVCIYMHACFMIHYILDYLSYYLYINIVY